MRQDIIRYGSAAMLFVAGAYASAATEIANCEASAITDINTAATFVEQNLAAIAARLTFLTERQRDEFVRKWPRIKLRCIERVSCRHIKVVGFSHGGPGNTLNICYDNMVDLGQRQCDLIETIVHESGHAHGFPRVLGHNHPTPAIKAKDKIYRMGFLAKAVCQQAVIAGTFVDKALPGTPRAGIGDACQRDADCRSLKCTRDKCVCSEDVDCGVNQVCLTLGSNTCEPASLAAGATCKRDRQCVSKKCRRDRCT
jgi:hypothetical protein